MNKTVIFDLDDTLVATDVYYRTAYNSFVAVLLKDLHYKTPLFDVLEDELIAVHVANSKKIGFGHETFTKSMIDYYKILCKKVKTHLNLASIETIKDIGSRIYSEKIYQEYGLLNGVSETLDFLVEQEDKLVLVTKGVWNAQLGKIKSTGLEKWFKNYWVVDSKTKEFYAEKFSKEKLETAVTIGNSVKSDINPALEAGVSKGVWIPYPVWGGHEDAKILKPESVKIVKDIKEIISIYCEL